ncbi:regulatory protein RecX [Litoribacillus peritrichatus]
MGQTSNMFPETDHQDLYKQAKLKAVDLLARREQSRFELKSKLARNSEFSEDLIEAVLEEMMTLGYQSDARFTEVFIRHRANSGYGPLRISRELYGKGIPQGLFRDVSEQEAVDFFEIAAKLYARKFSPDIIKDYKSYQKSFRYMANRGFSSEHIQHAKDLLLSSCEGQ